MTRDKIGELQALLRHQIPDADLGKIFDRALDLLLEETRRKRFAVTSRPRQRRKSEASSRYVPAEIKRAVFTRDEGRCRFVDDRGRRCEAREFLELHHVRPWATSRCHSVAGIMLLCRAHNQYEAEREFGAAHMARCRGVPPTGPGASC